MLRIGVVRAAGHAAPPGSRGTVRDMGAWIDDVVLQPGESVVWGVPATSSQHGIGRGGRLTLTTAALVFHPHRVDAATGGTPWRVPLTAVREVGVQPVALGDLFAGGLRRRLRLDLEDGSVVVLLVNRLARRVREVREAVLAARVPR